MLSLLGRLPPRVGVVFAAALALFTTHKLYKMCCIRGFVGERRIEAHRVRDKTVEHGAKNRTFCFVSWAEDAREDDRRHRLAVDCDYWETVKPDDRIEVVRLGEDSDIYLRGNDDIFASNGQFIFDLVLLGLELAGILYYWSRMKEHSQT